MTKASTPQRIPIWLKFGLMVAFLFLASLAILRSNSLPHDHPIEHTEGEKRRPFPNLTLIDEQGYKTKLDKFKGKVLLVSFWATWCQPCLEELPIFAKLAKEFAEDLAIIAINQDDDADVKPTIDKIWSDYKIPFITYYDPGHNLARTVNLEVLPTNYILDRHGRLAFSSHGAFNWSGENALKLLRELIAEEKNNSTNSVSK